MRPTVTTTVRLVLKIYRNLYSYHITRIVGYRFNQYTYCVIRDIRDVRDIRNVRDIRDIRDIHDIRILNQQFFNH